MPLYPAIKLVDTVIAPDAFDFTTEPTASEGRYIGDCESKVYLTTRLLGDGSDGGIIIDYKPTESLAVDPTNPNTGDDSKPDSLVGVSGRDWTLDSQPELTSEPTAPEAVAPAGGMLVGMGDGSVRFLPGSNDSIWMDMGFPERADAGYLNPSSFQITSAGDNEAGSRPATAHVAISLGDGKAIEAAGDDYGIGEWSDPAQPDGGTDISPWTVTHSSNSGSDANPDTFDCSELVQWASGTAQEGDVPKGDWITDVTYQSVELLGQPAIETLEIAHEGFLR